MTLSSTVIRKQYSYIVTNSRWLLPVELASALEASKRLGDKSILLGESDASLLQPTLGQQPRRAAVHPGTVLVGKSLRWWDLLRPARDSSFACMFRGGHPGVGLLFAANIGPVVAGPLIMHAHLFTFWVWLIAALIVTQVRLLRHCFRFLPAVFL